MKRSILLIFVPVFAMALITGCQGDKGDEGEQGIQGVQGIQGAQGETGTANVIYSEWTTLYTYWRDSTILSANLKVNHLNVPALTQEIIDRGVVLCYYKLSTTVVPLPMTTIAFGLVYTLNFEPDLNKIIFTLLTHDNSGSISLSSEPQFRYVIIPGGIAATAKKSTLDLTKLSYEQICTLFNISE